MSIVCLASYLLTCVSGNKAYGQQNFTPTANDLTVFDQPNGNVLTNNRTDNNLTWNSAKNSSKPSDIALLPIWVFSGLFVAGMYILLPALFLKYNKLINYRFRKFARLENENVKTICCKFTQELAHIKRRNEITVETNNPASAHMIAQLADIRQRLIHRINEVRTRFRRKKRANSQEFRNPGYGLVSIYWGCVMLSLMACVLANTILYTYTNMVESNTLIALASLLAYIAPPLLFITLCMSDEKLLRHKPKPIEHARQQIQAILDKPPYLRFCAEHYHKTTDCNGNTQDSVLKKTFS